MFTRRRVLQLSSGAVLTSVIASPPLVQAQPTGASIVTPGQRIDGVAKVTGQRIYARDYRFKHMDGWPDTGLHARFLRATTTRFAFEGLDLSGLLPDALMPRTIIYGDMIPDNQLAPALAAGRDLDLDRDFAADSPHRDDTGEAPQFDRPKAVSFDLVVKRGAQPDFLGQAVALLFWDNVAAWRAAGRLLQFRTGDVSVYGSTEGLPVPRTAYAPKTHYVRDAKLGFSYAQSANTEVYDDDVPSKVAGIDAHLAGTPDLIAQPMRATMPAMDPMFMEPESGLAWHDQDGRILNLVLGTQSPDGDVDNIGEMYDTLPESQKPGTVHLTACYPGGGFGGRDGSPFSLMLALAAGFAQGRPVRLAYDRFEQFQVGLKRHACEAEGTLWLTGAGRIDTLRLSMRFDGGGRKNLSPYVAQLAALCAGGGYVIDRSDITSEAHRSENIAGGSQRGFGGPQAFFALETALDEAAHNQGWDPVDLRKVNLAVKGDRTVVGGLIDQQQSLNLLLETAESHPVWAAREGTKARYADAGLRYGTGLAMSQQAYGTSSDGVVGAVAIDAQGQISARTNAVDMGNGSATTLAAVVAGALGQPAHRIVMGDATLWPALGMTTAVPAKTVAAAQDGKHLPKPALDGTDWANPEWTAKSVGSSSACLTAFHQVHAMQQAARALFLETLLPAARDLWDAPRIPEAETGWHDGALVAAGQDLPPLPLAELAARAAEHGAPLEAFAHAFFRGDWVRSTFDLASGPTEMAADGLAFATAYGGGAAPRRRMTVTEPPADTARSARTVWAPAINVIGVSVDPASGMVRVEKALTVLNAGAIHVPGLVSGQSQGGLAQAIGYTLLEDVPPGMAGPADGAWNLNRYAVPRYHDVPMGDAATGLGRFQDLVTIHDAGETTGRGIAEAVMCAVAPAISNALRDATGHRFLDLPITADRVRAALG